jgi:hypothetical protein
VEKLYPYIITNPAIKQANRVMPDLIPAKDGIFDRHPGSLVTGNLSGFRLSPE